MTVKVPFTISRSDPPDCTVIGEPPLFRLSSVTFPVTVTVADTFAGTVMVLPVMLVDKV